MSILLLSISMNGLNAIGGAIAAADGQVKGFALKTLLLHLVNIGFAVVLVAFLHSGAVGAAGASLAASMLVNVSLVWPYCRKLAGVTTKVWIREVVFPCLSPAVASAAYCIAVLHFFEIDGWFQLIALSALSGLVYGIVVLRFGLRPQDWRDIDRLIERIPARFSPLLRVALRNRR
jgi:O-antigen/teichoic acid export membrane protein